MKRYRITSIPTLFAIIFLAAGLFSCTPDTPTSGQIKIFADFYVRYLKPERELKAYAAFLEGNTIEEGQSKTFPGGVNFLAKAMDPKKLSDETTRYQYAERESYPKEMVFSFLQTDGAQQRFEAALESLDTFGIQEGCSKTSGMALDLYGTRLAADETLLLLLTDTNAHAYTLQKDGPTEGESIRFSPQQLVHLPAGALDVYLVRKKLVQGIRDNYDFRIALEYYSDVLTISTGE